VGEVASGVAKGVVNGIPKMVMGVGNFLLKGATYNAALELGQSSEEALKIAEDAVKDNWDGTVLAYENVEEQLGGVVGEFASPVVVAKGVQLAGQGIRLGSQALGGVAKGADVLAAEQAAIRARVLANIEASAAARTSSNFEIHALNERVPFLDVSTPTDRAIVWSNKRGGNFSVADEFIAQNPGYLRLEDTPGGKYLQNLNLFERYDYEQAIQPWDRLSAKYANGASGQVTAFTSGASPTSVFQRVELPILLRNPNVTDIKYMPPLRTQP
jgi:hypothetical protein